ncbi:MAG: xanthine phosphoribosyltransferase [Clostridia bacterium]|nr:xanthine phosphoribosyltransferase [Clostridia bacterium]
MKTLEQRILQEGKAINRDVLKVDMFLNHQVDVKLMYEIGAEFKRLFEDKGITRVVTIEASGIAPAAMTALQMDLPLVILKKSHSVILSTGTIQTEVYSFTKQSTYNLTLNSAYIKTGDRVLLIDDFLANGEAALGASRLIEQAGAKVAGIGIVICKSFQPGLKKLREMGYAVEPLANIAEMDKDFVRFVKE